MNEEVGAQYRVGVDFATGEDRTMTLNAAREMPKYRCHKEVHALKILAITTHEDGTRALYFTNADFAPVTVSAQWYHKHEPEAGGYYVVYADGYTSYSPAAAFEDGYHPMIHP